MTVTESLLHSAFNVEAERVECSTEAEVRANDIVNSYVKYLSERSSISDLIKSSTVWTFQIQQRLGCGGLLLKTPATKEQILVCSSTDFL